MIDSRFRVILEKMEKCWMGWMELPFSLKKEENAGFEPAISESTIVKVFFDRIWIKMNFRIVYLESILCHI